MKLRTDSVRILADSLRKSGKRREAPCGSGSVVIVNGGAIGDTILFLDALNAMAQYFNGQNRETWMICRPAIQSFLSAVCPELPVKCLAIPFHDYLTNDACYRRISERLREFSGSFLIVPHQSKFADFISLNIPAKRKIQLKTSSQTTRASPYYWLNRVCYDDTLTVAPSMMALERYAFLLHEIGISDFQSKIKPLPPHEVKIDFSAHAPYCVVAPTSSEEPKCWEPCKFCEVIDYILVHSNLNVCLCAGREGDGLYEKIRSAVSRPERMVDYIGRTNFTEWVELIRHAKFCFGNDSASIHVAAHTSTPSVAVTSGLDYQYCQPYRYEQSSNSDAVPVCVYAHKDCFGCYRKNLKRCAGNLECRENVGKGGKYLCIRDIAVEQVIPEIDRLLKSDIMEGKEDHANERADPAADSGKRGNQKEDSGFSGTD